MRSALFLLAVPLIAQEAYQLTELKAETRKVWTEMSGNLFPPELLDKVRGLLADYRARKKETPSNRVGSGG